MFDGYNSGEANSVATTERYPKRNFVSDIKDADVAVVRVFSRGGIYSGIDGGVPLSYDGISYRYDQEKGVYTNEVLEDNSLTGEGNYQTAPYRSHRRSESANGENTESPRCQEIQSRA